MQEIAYYTPTGEPIYLPSEWKSEDQLNAFCYQWVYNTLPKFRGLIFHVPNELPIPGKKGMIFRSQNKSKGVVAGIPDFVVIWPKIAGLEGKLPGCKPSDEQKEIHARWVEAGRHIFLYDSFRAFQKIVGGLLADCYPHPDIYNFLSKQ